MQTRTIYRKEEFNMNPKPDLPWFDREGNLQRKIPEECVKDCTHMGPCDADVKYWREKLNFEVPRQLAILYIKDIGAYEEEETEEMTHEELAEYILWCVCFDIKEHGEFFGLVQY